MPVNASQFQGEAALAVLKYPFYGKANINAELGAIATALGTDTSVHDRTIETPASPALQFGKPANTDFTDAILALVNKGKGGNLSNAAMASALVAAELP